MEPFTTDAAVFILQRVREFGKGEALSAEEIQHLMDEKFPLELHNTIWERLLQAVNPKDAVKEA